MTTGSPPSSFPPQIGIDGLADRGYDASHERRRFRRPARETSLFHGSMTASAETSDASGMRIAGEGRASEAVSKLLVRRVAHRARPLHPSIECRPGKACRFNRESVQIDSVRGRSTQCETAQSKAVVQKRALRVDVPIDIGNQSVTSPSRVCRGTRMRLSQIAR